MNGFNVDQLAPKHTSSHHTKPLDPEEFRRQGHMVKDFLADYFRDIEKFLVLSQVELGYLRKRLPKFSWISSPAATELETIVMDWLGEMLQLPKAFLFSGNGGDIEAGRVPLFLCATVGTTSTSAVDPLRSLCEVANTYGMWVHIDAAYAASAYICPEFRHFVDGVEAANSFSHAHKCFLTTLDCCCLWVKDPGALIKSLSTTPEFLRNKATDSKEVVDYKDWQIALSRRFRALTLRFVRRGHGVANLRDFLRSHIKMAKLFEGLVTMDKRFEIVVYINFAMVCFRLLPRPAILGKETKYRTGRVDDHDDKYVKRRKGKCA
ncbi:Tyrosine/DOPA decarboxylase 5 [Morella rubra]|uniref:Tyrosine/DOPA decarboxylase 5 n=1 Tax=Morella rubra TaxID=262757 RepID=A0A6A1WC86_9ROSI|nr:Tyrosine/DOPA decarboxylase 5 [Morella rubra]